MISQTLKSFLKIPIEFPLIQYLKNYIKFYFINPVNLTREQFFKRYKFYQSFYFNKLIHKHNSASKVPIDIFIPTIRKDLDVLPYVVKYARLNIKHPIHKIFIVAPEDDEIKELATTLNCVFVDERTVMGYGKEKITYKFNGIDASGWLYQQLLKLNCYKVCEKEHILVLDSDLLIINPKKFEHKGKFILEFSDEFHLPYFETYFNLMHLKHQLPVSFISHHMLFKKSILIDLQQFIEEKHQKKWDEKIIALIPGEIGHFFSEYETYANFVLHNSQNSYIFEYWFNTVLNRNELSEIDNDMEHLKKSYKTITFPAYLK